MDIDLQELWHRKGAGPGIGGRDNAKADGLQFAKGSCAEAVPGGGEDRFCMGKGRRRDRGPTCGQIGAYGGGRAGIAEFGGTRAAGFVIEMSISVLQHHHGPGGGEARGQGRVKPRRDHGQMNRHLMRARERKKLVECRPRRRGIVIAHP